MEAEVATQAATIEAVSLQKAKPEFVQNQATLIMETEATVLVNKENNFAREATPIQAIDDTDLTVVKLLSQEVDCLYQRLHQTQSSKLIHIRDKLAATNGSADLIEKREESQKSIDDLLKEGQALLNQRSRYLMA